jgi:hypothetical protein
MTIFGISNYFYMGIEENPFQGLIQGNRATSLGFLIIAIILVRALYQNRLVPATVSPITRMISYLARQIFIDNIDLNIMN